MFITKGKIKKWLEEMNILHYVINDDLTVNVNRHVFLAEKQLNEIPIQFGVVNGDFFCNNNNLLNLKGSPKKVLGNFYCSKNKLNTLEGAPEYIANNFSVHHNQLTNLKYSPKYIGGQFVLYDNPIEILTLEDLPHSVKELCFQNEEIDYLIPLYNNSVLKINLHDLKTVIFNNTLDEKIMINNSNNKKINKI